MNTYSVAQLEAERRKAEARHPLPPPPLSSKEALDARDAELIKIHTKHRRKLMRRSKEDICADAQFEMLRRHHAHGMAIREIADLAVKARDFYTEFGYIPMYAGDIERKIRDLNESCVALEAVQTVMVGRMPPYRRKPKVS